MPNTTEVLSKALRKITSAAGGLGLKAVAIGAMAHQAWGSKREVPGLEVLISSGPQERETLLGAARGEGFQQSPDGPLRLRYTDAKLAATVTADLTEATTPFHAQVIARAQRADVLSSQMLLATCEDLILLGADRAVLVELLRNNASRIDGAYLKREAEAAGVFGEVKLAWQQAKQ
ncbi:MAG TPA: hypothetical protein VEN81_15325 [Planctomycetota bacterium]|jgi:hypothetical protein|nr:hypothetical protein [Planctomycetota bacterium]